MTNPLRSLTPHSSIELVKNFFYIWRSMKKFLLDLMYIWKGKNIVSLSFFAAFVSLEWLSCPSVQIIQAFRGGGPFGLTECDQVFPVRTLIFMMFPKKSISWVYTVQLWIWVCLLSKSFLTLEVYSKGGTISTFWYNRGGNFFQSQCRGTVDFGPGTTPPSPYERLPVRKNTEKNKVFFCASCSSREWSAWKMGRWIRL